MDMGKESDVDGTGCGVCVSSNSPIMENMCYIRIFLFFSQMGLTLLTSVVLPIHSRRDLHSAIIILLAQRENPVDNFSSVTTVSLVLWVLGVAYSCWFLAFLHFFSSSGNTSHVFLLLLHLLCPINHQVLSPLPSQDFSNSFSYLNFQCDYFKMCYCHLITSLWQQPPNLFLCLSLATCRLDLQWSLKTESLIGLSPA